jgi:hypothetical protein
MKFAAGLQGLLGHNFSSEDLKTGNLYSTWYMTIACTCCHCSSRRDGMQKSLQIKWLSLIFLLCTYMVFLHLVTYNVSVVPLWVWALGFFSSSLNETKETERRTLKEHIYMQPWQYQMVHVEDEEERPKSGEWGWKNGDCTFEKQNLSCHFRYVQTYKCYCFIRVHFWGFGHLSVFCDSMIHFILWGN